LPELVEAYKAIAYACATLNANGVARVPLRLYVTTRHGQARPKVATKALRRDRETQLRRRGLVHKAVEIDEVVEHPLLEALHEVNPDFDHNALLRYTVLCLDVVGAAYWRPEPNRLGVAAALWPLQAQYVTPIHVAGESAVSEYRYFQESYAPDDLVRMRHVSVRDPHGFGYGPTQAAFEYVGLGDKYVSVQENLLGQGVRPSVLVSPKEATLPMGHDERRRFEAEINARWTAPNAGRAWVVDGAIDVHPLTFPPSDLAALEIHDHALQRVANCFGVPVSLLKTEDVNLANAEAGHRQHAELAIEPRCGLIAGALSKWVRAEGRRNGLGWDRLFFAFDNPVAEDAERRARIFDMYLRNGTLTINDVRPELGYDAVPWGDEPWNPGKDLATDEHR
jgi:HK97 family phage portal protein